MMLNVKKDFAMMEGNTWLNAASEGPLPLVAKEKLSEAIEWKSKPYLLDIPKFTAVPVALKKSISALLNLSAQDIIIGNSASYGLHLIANGFPFEEGDEILLMQNDFPTNILPWMYLQEQGIQVKQICAQNTVLTPDELRQNITPQTKLFCISHVHTFSGYKLDIEAFAKICEENNILFILNVTQSVGTMPLDISQLKVDAIVCAGYKWLCGPYGTGFCWIKPDLRRRLELNHAYWTVMCDEADLTGKEKIHGKDPDSARRYDQFGTANFFNFVPLQASIQYLLDIGLEAIQSHQNILNDQIIAGLESLPFYLVSSLEQEKRSSLTVISHENEARNKEIFDFLKENHVHTAFWKGNIRITPHIYNSPEDIDILLKKLSLVKST